MVIQLTTDQKLRDMIIVGKSYAQIITMTDSVMLYTVNKLIEFTSKSNKIQKLSHKLKWLC